MIYRMIFENLKMRHTKWGADATSCGLSFPRRAGNGEHEAGGAGPATHGAPARRGSSYPRTKFKAPARREARRDRPERRSRPGSCPQAAS
jgi:hypothetical protein